jgi:hypothetical protein
MGHHLRPGPIKLCYAVLRKKARLITGAFGVGGGWLAGVSGEPTVTSGDGRLSIHRRNR